eukprot:ctg_71.g20
MCAACRPAVVVDGWRCPPPARHRGTHDANTGSTENRLCFRFDFLCLHQRVVSLYESLRGVFGCVIRARPGGAGAAAGRSAVVAGCALLHPRASVVAGFDAHGDALCSWRARGGDGHAARAVGWRCAHAGGDLGVCAAGAGHGDAGERTSRRQRVHGSVCAGVRATGRALRAPHRVVSLASGVRLLAVGHRRQHAGVEPATSGTVAGDRDRPVAHHGLGMCGVGCFPHLPRGVHSVRCCGDVGGGGTVHSAAEAGRLRRARAPLLRTGGVVVRVDGGRGVDAAAAAPVLGQYAGIVQHAVGPGVCGRPGGRFTGEDRKRRGGRAARALPGGRHGRVLAG